MYSVVLATMMTAGAAAPANGYGYAGVSMGGSISVSAFCSGCYSCCSCCGCSTSYFCCGGTCACGYYVSPYSLNYGCCGMADCRSVLMAPLCSCGYSGYASCYGCCGCCCGGSLMPAPATTPAPTKEMPKLPEPTPESAFDNMARVLIKAPLDMRISVNGQPTARDAAEMTFRTPALQQDKNYSYQVKAEVVREGKTVTETKRVLVRAGQQAVADFTALNRPAVAQTGGTRTAQVTVQMPKDAQLYVDGVPYPLAPNQRTFMTPALQTGKDYFYELKARVVRDGQVQTETRKITVEPGKHVKVAFKTLDNVQTASR